MAEVWPTDDHLRSSVFSQGFEAAQIASLWDGSANADRQSCALVVGAMGPAGLTRGVHRDRSANDFSVFALRTGVGGQERPDATGDLVRFVDGKAVSGFANEFCGDVWHGGAGSGDQDR